MTNADEIQDWQGSSEDLVAKIKTARAEAQAKMNAYKNLTAKRHDYWRAVAAIHGYDDALTMFKRGTEHYIPSMAVIAIVDFELARDGETTEITLAVTHGRKDALASVAEWMNTKENRDS